MPFRVSIADICVAAVVAVVVLLPERSPSVRAEYPDSAPVAELGEYQARLGDDPGDGVAVQKLCALLVKLHQSDWALRVAGEGTRHADSPTVWRSYLALSSAHADRFEIREAHRNAEKAFEACEAPGADCPAHERVRLLMFLRELDAGIEAIRRGIDPRSDPRAFRDAVNKAYPRARLPGRTDQPDDEKPQPKPGPETKPQPQP